MARTVVGVQRSPKWPKAGRLLKTIREKRGLTQHKVVKVSSEQYGEAIFGEERELRRAEKGEQRVKPRLGLIFLLAKIYKQEDVAIVNDVLSKSRYDLLSQKEIDDFSLKYVRGDFQREHLRQNRSQGLVANFSLDGNAKDQSGNANHETVYGGVCFVREAARQVAKFDGSSGYLSISDRPALRLDQFTLAAWVCLGTTQGRRRIIQKGKSYWLFMYHDRPLVGFWNGARYFDLVASSQVKTGKWHFMAGTFDNRVLRFYLDGDCLVDIHDFRVPVKPEQNREPLIIGWKYGGTPENYFAGKMRDVVIYNRALTDGEIYDLYAAGRLDNGK